MARASNRLHRSKASIKFVADPPADAFPKGFARFVVRDEKDRAAADAGRVQLGERMLDQHAAQTLLAVRRRYARRLICRQPKGDQTEHTRSIILTTRPPLHID